MTHEWRKHSGTQMHCTRCGVTAQGLDERGEYASLSRASKHEFSANIGAMPMTQGLDARWRPTEPKCIERRSPEELAALNAPRDDSQPNFFQLLREKLRNGSNP